MADERYRLRQELWNQFINNKDGMRATDIVSQLDQIHDIYDEFGDLIYHGCTKRMRYLKNNPRKVDKVCSLEKEYLVIWIQTYYLVIDMNKNTLVTNSTELEQIGKLNGFIIDDTFDNVDEIVAFYRNYEPVFSISPKIRYVVSLEEKGAYSVFSISLCYRNAIFGFYTLDQFLYETITFDDSLRPYIDDTKKRVSKEELKKIINGIGDIVIPYSVIPKELFVLGILKDFNCEREEQGKIKIVDFNRNLC